MIEAQELQKKIKLEFMLCSCVSFMLSPTFIYNLISFKKLTQI